MEKEHSKDCQCLACNPLNCNPGTIIHIEEALAPLLVDKDSGYASLAAHLSEAFMQAAEGKGKERHANNLPFEKQIICQGCRDLGSIDGAIYQARKKAAEAVTLLKIKGKEAAKAELYGAINYLAAACIVIDEME